MTKAEVPNWHLLLCCQDGLSANDASENWAANWNIPLGRLVAWWMMLTLNIVEHVVSYTRILKDVVLTWTLQHYLLLQFAARSALGFDLDFFFGFCKDQLSARIHNIGNWHITGPRSPYIHQLSTKFVQGLGRCCSNHCRREPVGILEETFRIGKIQDVDSWWL